MWTGGWLPSVQMSTRMQMAPGEEKILGYYGHFSGLPTTNYQFFDFLPTGANNPYPDDTLAAAQSMCRRFPSYGNLVVNNFGFEYTQTVERQTVTKKQIGTRPLVVRCIDPYAAYIANCPSEPWG
jgi:hypothetical protein